MRGRRLRARLARARPRAKVCSVDDLDRHPDPQLAAGTVGGIVGFGSSIMLMPILMVAFGPQEAVPIMAIAALLANLSRVAVLVARDRLARQRLFIARPRSQPRPWALAPCSSSSHHLIEASLGLLFMAMVPISALADGTRPAYRPLASVHRWRRYRLSVRDGRLDRADQHAVLLAYGLVKGAYLIDRGARIHGRRHHQSHCLPAFRRATAGDGAARIDRRGLGNGWLAGLPAASCCALMPQQFRSLMDGLCFALVPILLWVGIHALSAGTALGW